VIPDGPRLGDLVVSVHNLTVKMDDRVLFNNLSFEIKKGDIMGIVGPNGTGKTTLFKVIVGEREPEQGEVKLGATVEFAYGSQSREALDPNNMVYQEICGEMEYVDISPNVKLNARSYVAQFNFKGEVQQKFIHQLSGGERNRVQLAKALAKGANVILLDEPTNDLDVDTLRALEESMLDFEGAAIVISHDRWFLDRICTCILGFEENGDHLFVRGNYNDFERERRRVYGGQNNNEGGKKKFKMIA